MTAGGRVLDVTATAPTLREARDRAYGADAYLLAGDALSHDIAGGAAEAS